MERLAAADRRVHGLRLIRNFGEHVAMTAGLDRVDADRVVIMACDLQDDPAAIPALLSAAAGGADLVLVRRMKRRDAFVKRLLARLFYAVISLLFHVRYDYRVGNYRLLTRRASSIFRLHRERMRNVNAIMALMKLETAYVDVAHRPRRHGRSTHTAGTLGPDGGLGHRRLLGHPAARLGAFGGLLLAAALVWTLVMAVRYAGGLAPSEGALVVCAVAGIGGLILVNLGIVGAYLGRAAREAKERPMYFVGEATPGVAVEEWMAAGRRPVA